MKNDSTGFLEPSLEECLEALKNIRDNAYSPIGDDWIWMDDQTPLGLYIDSIIQRI